jgi:hypothetical protein
LRIESVACAVDDDLERALLLEEMGGAGDDVEALRAGGAGEIVERLPTTLWR